MKRILNLIGVFAISLLMMTSYSLAQSKKSSKGTQNMNKQATMKNDTDYAKSMAYYKYAEKNIITNKSKAETYKGRFYGQKNMEKTNPGMSNSKMSNSNMKMNESHKTMMSSNDKMIKKNKKSDKSKWSSAKSKTKKEWKKKTN